MKRFNTKILKQYKKRENPPLQMLTCYDYQTAQLLNETSLDLILVGDSLGNVILGYETTIKVSLEEMIIFSQAVRRGAPEKFIVCDLPFGCYTSVMTGLRHSVRLFQESGVEALKLEGAFPHHLKLIRRLVESGIPVMGHIGVTPQSVHQQGGYYVQGNDEKSAKNLLIQARSLEKAGVFSVVLECVNSTLAERITEKLSIPTIGIGSGTKTDGQVLVINDLLGLGRDDPPGFCSPMADFYKLKKETIENYLKRKGLSENEYHPHH